MYNLRKASILFRKRNIRTRFARRGIYADICRKIRTANEVFQHDTR